MPKAVGAGLGYKQRDPAHSARQGLRSGPASTHQRPCAGDARHQSSRHQTTPKTGELYSLGVNAYLDDNYIHLHGRRTINEVNLLWREWFDGLYADGATTGRLMVLHLHPWIMGQPWRIRHLDEVLGHISAYQGVWKATGSEIIDWFKAQSG